MESIEVLVKELGQSAACNIVELNLIYPKTANLHSDKCLYTAFFEASLLESIREILGSIELKALDARAPSYYQTPTWSLCTRAG